MNSVLEKIIKNKKREVKQRKKEVPIARLFELIQNLPTHDYFSKGLYDSGTVEIIAEIKKSSPSAGLLRQNFDPISIAKSYEINGAWAISILTDEKFFKGNLKCLYQVRQVVKLPLLRKDFIIDPYQAIEARAYGADAILLILRILSKMQCIELEMATREINLDILVEVHTIEELERALSYGFSFIGINNRNLNTFEVNFKTTEKLLAALPKDVIVVSESGIKKKEDIQRLGQIGVDAVLIGEAFMRQADIGAALKQFVGVPKWSR
ncbi:MAG: indole-3-glycerol phosphate synthase TrpC [bacterium]